MDCRWGFPLKAIIAIMVTVQVVDGLIEMVIVASRGSSPPP